MNNANIKVTVEIPGEENQIFVGKSFIGGLVTSDLKDDFTRVEMVMLGEISYGRLCFMIVSMIESTAFEMKELKIPKDMGMMAVNEGLRNAIERVKVMDNE